MSAKAAACIGLGLLASTGDGLAQTPRPAVPPGWHVRHVRIVSHRATDLDDGYGGRRLTVHKPFVPPAETGDVFTESGVVYGDIAAFVPEPKIDSGVQFPYGLDGVGGYGSDIGFSAGNDGSVYDRGALDRARALRAGVE